MTRRDARVQAPLLTPVDEAFEPDAARLAAHAEAVTADGCHRLVLFGTTGEATSFSVRQRMACLERLLARGVAADRLVVGTGCPALADTVTLTADALDKGCAGVLVLPPYYYKGVSDEGLFAWYAEVLERINANRRILYLYHFPKLSGVPITDGLIERLREAYPETLAGIKDSSGDTENTRGWLEHYPDLEIYPGSERDLAALLDAGAAGVISAVANVNAAAMRALTERRTAGARDLDRLQAELERVRDIFDGLPMIPALKAAAAERYGDEAWYRCVPPNRPLSAEAAARCLAELQACLRGRASPIAQR